jgi:hypothetical protein
LRQCREERRLADAQVLWGFAEVAECRRADAEELVAVGCAVQVLFEDRTLVKSPFEPHREHRLADLRGDRAAASRLYKTD